MALINCSTPITSSYANGVLTLSGAADLDTILKQIENRHYRWVAFRSDVILFFVSPGNTGQAMCGGELIYERLDERMLLTCHFPSAVFSMPTRSVCALSTRCRTSG